MIRVIPSMEETLVLPFGINKLLSDLAAEVDVNGDQPEKLFNGSFNHSQFLITQKLKRPDNFIPLIKGNIESSSKGCIIFIKYRLLFSTRLFLIFWSITLLLMAIFMGLKYEAYVYSGIALSVGLVNYLIVYYNFRQKTRANHKMLLKVLLQ